jgi:phosphate:Na+ symporter
MKNVSIRGMVMNYKMVFSLLGGLGLFIYGMKLMGDGLQKAAGDRLKKILEVLTTNRFLGVFIGTIVTMIIQSSSATTVMIVGFVNAGLMNLAQAAGVIMGANIGTTITAQLLAFKLTDIAPLVLGIGAALVMFAKKKRTRDIGEIILGFGILFVGMDVMSKSMEPLRSNEFLSVPGKTLHCLIGENISLRIVKIHCVYISGTEYFRLTLI